MDDVDLARLSDLCTPWCIRVAVTLRIPDHIAGGHNEIGDLAEAAGCDRDFLHRLLRHLAREGVFAESEPGRFELTAAGQQLRDPAQRLFLDLDAFGGRMSYVWGSLLSAVRTGKPAYHEVFGRPFWDDLAAHPQLAATFDDLMGPDGHGVPDPEVLPRRDWESVRTVVDVGGGTGALLAQILLAHPDVRGTLVDLPGTIARAESTFVAAGVADRVTTVEQSFFEELPAGGDLYLLKNLLADWPDAEAVALLRRCAEAITSSGRLVVLGGVSDQEEADPELLMLVLLGGMNRTLSEFRELAATAGLEVTASGTVDSGKFAVECRRIAS